MSESNAFGKTICSICYEDLKPLIEDLQSISICGHVFHELCLQQWLEYCSGTKKCTCPVCKQRCSQEDVGRLYFQSIGDANDTQKPSEGLLNREQDKDPVLLLREVNKLKGKVSAISSTCERQEQNLKELNEELSTCKEQLKEEIVLKKVALQQKSNFQALLRSKAEELDKTASDCSRLQERNMALAKELAALKLVSDVNLDEEEIVKLASLGHGINSKDTVDVLKKSLVLRNKSYKELMAQCNILGRGETRSLRKLEKAKQKMKNLKTRVRELELALEERDNEALRSLKASGRTSGKAVDLDGAKSNTPCITKFLATYQTEHPAEPAMISNQSGGLTNLPILFRKTGNFDFRKTLGLNSRKKSEDVIDVDQEKDLHVFMDDSSSEQPQPMLEDPPTIKTPPNNHFRVDIKKPSVSGTRVEFLNMDSSLENVQSNSIGLPTSCIGSKTVMHNTVIDAMEDDVVHINNPSSAVEELSADEIMEIPPFNIRKEVSSPVPIPNSGDQCFAGGLLGPDGANRYLGKWCKRTQHKASVLSSTTMQEPSTSTRDLIAVGADGRGGRVKILRSQNQLDAKGSSVLPKRRKSGSKQSSQQSQGCMQIEHFFAKAD
ncbi:E3 ubiquitin-protein ligase traip-like [Thalictrum thalictroides]|uniref:E3 ubiquitin-protein ligase traip-like n=1 Tax=Thalictrum thalictroides TaxID=46969 RepID=A0A7J6UW02_THATH|nr:E3 ubiquitin-protein ligase traip-like [Thalictrum thalictroides]